MKEVSLNFGAIRDSIYNFSTKELFKEGVNESKTMKAFLKEIKEDHILRIQYLIFKNLEKGYFKKESLAERYINQNLKLLENVSWYQILDTNKKLRLGILKEYHVEGATKEKNELYEQIQVLIEAHAKKSFSDVNLYHQTFESVLNYLLKEKTEDQPKEQKDMPKFFSMKFITELAVSNFNARYAHLNEEERKLLKILLSTYENKINHLESLKKENLEMINDIYKTELNEDDKNTIQNFEQKLKNLTSVTYNNIDEFLINCSELNLTLKGVK